jgi:hypothetical protein
MKMKRQHLYIDTNAKNVSDLSEDSGINDDSDLSEDSGINDMEDNIDANQPLDFSKDSEQLDFSKDSDKIFFWQVTNLEYYERLIVQYNECLAALNQHKENYDMLDRKASDITLGLDDNEAKKMQEEFKKYQEKTMN